MLIEWLRQLAIQNSRWNVGIAVFELVFFRGVLSPISTGASDVHASAVEWLRIDVLLSCAAFNSRSALVGRTLECVVDNDILKSRDMIREIQLNRLMDLYFHYLERKMPAMFVSLSSLYIK
jgi:hypothetical protein